jgi:D-alanyl-D-alanine carboxypeptidase/D-alanyl-D-alanine-endopeptidase (penicillin-binding protein 4)
MVDGGRVRPGSAARVPDPAKQAAQVFAGYLRSLGLDVVAVQRGRAPADAAEIARIESPPVADIVEGMLTESENTQAEMLAHLVGSSALGDGSFAGGAEATEAALVELGLDTSGLELVDGSGLSGRNRASARLLADLLVDVTDDPALAPIAPGLAVAGLTGTLADRFQSAATRAGRGVVRAKTGTLTGVVALAGTVLDRDGRVLVFAIIANRVRSIPATRETMDRVASRLATCGCADGTAR